MVTAATVRDITQQIKELLDAAGLLLAEVHANKLWKHLDYTSFSAYVAGEFGFSRSKAYKIFRTAEINSRVSRARDKLSQRAAVELARFPEELQVAIAETAESYTVSQSRPRTARDIKIAGEVLTQIVSTGHVDTGNGEMSAFNAALIQEDHERLMRMHQHIEDSRREWRTLETWELDSAPAVFEMPVSAIGKQIKVVILELVTDEPAVS